jgi:hypothetical protein
MTYVEDEPEAKRIKTDKDETESTPKSRQIRLEQNRKAAKESRRRKKMMIEGECHVCVYVYVPCACVSQF